MTKRPWQADELELLAWCYADTATRELAQLLERPPGSVHQKARTLGLRKSLEFVRETARARSAQPGHGGVRTRFAPGQAPANKGLRRPGWAPGRMRETQFRPGQNPRNWMPVGATRTIDGYLYRKVADLPKVPYTVNWKPVHILRWERFRGPVPPGHALLFRDGNRAHIRLPNLELVARAELMRRNSVHRLPAALQEVIRLKAAIRSVVTKRRKKACPATK